MDKISVWKYMGMMRSYLLRTILLICVFVGGVGSAWGDDIVSGKYYRIYTGSTWYLWPAAMTTNNQNAKEHPDDNLWAVTYNGITAEGYTGNGVDYDDYDETYSIWQVTQVTYEANTYYQLYNIGTQRYLVGDKTGQEGRAVHLEKSSTIKDWTKTYFTYRSDKVLTPMGGSLSLNSYGGDKSYLVTVNSSNNPELNSNNNGLIGLWGTGKWNFTLANSATPEITYNSVTNRVTMTCATVGAKIYYKGYDNYESYYADTPSLSSGTDGYTLYDGEFTPTKEYYKAIAARDISAGNDQSEVSGICLSLPQVGEVVTFHQSIDNHSISMGYYEGYENDLIAGFERPCRVFTTNDTDTKQQWIIEDAGSGYVYLKNKFTGTYLYQAYIQTAHNDNWSIHFTNTITSTDNGPNDKATMQLGNRAKFEITLDNNGKLNIRAYNNSGKFLGLNGSDLNTKANTPVYADKTSLNTWTVGARVSAPIITVTTGNNVTITHAKSGTIYYTTDGTEPTTSYNEYTTTFPVDNGTTIKAIAVKDGVSSIVAVKYPVATPVIEFYGNGLTTITCETGGASIYYTTDGSDPTSSSTLYEGAFSPGEGVTIKAIAIKESMCSSAIASAVNSTITISSLSEITLSGGRYRLGSDIDAADFTESIASFSGVLDGGMHTISNLSVPIFENASGARIRNIILKDATITSGDDNGDAGAIACSATGATRIYNCGVLSGSVSGSRYVGSIVGLLDGSSRVINCFSYANVSDGTDGGGIVGYNNYASTNTDIKTMVMNCIYYGNVSSRTNISPIYGGLIINNAGSTGLNNYNYYSFEDFTSTITKYNCALGAEKRFLERFEFYRQILNSNRELAAWYATGSTDNARTVMAKWVLDRTVAKYPILKTQGKYPSIINYDAENAADSTSVGRNHGGKLGKTLTVKITQSTSAPSGASLSTTSLTLQRTDKDYDRYNFNYDKVQLPYYNEVGTGNCTHNKVVTGWKITGFTGGTAEGYSTGTDVTVTDGVVTKTPYNFADRNCTNKDLYSKSGRVFSQGAYFDVPNGVTGITIEPYWGTAAYLADPNYDKTYDTSYSGTDITAMGTRFENGRSYSINGDNQVVYTTMDNAIAGLSRSGGTVYDYAVVLVGNYHHYYGKNGVIDNTSNPFTIMSADLDNDNEPDYSFIYQHGERSHVSPIRFDFLCWPGIGMTQKPNGSPRMPGIGILRPNGWFEVTNTCLAQFQEFEYDKNGKTMAPLILLGGVVEQIVSIWEAKNAEKTQYIHLGSNVWFKMFNNGIHANQTNYTRHFPISVTGGDYESFYLSGMFRPDAAANAENAECYISGGRFGEVAGAGQEQINGDVYWQIDHADIESFFGGGINYNKPVTGNITTDIKNSNVTLFCGGPKFGDMSDGKKVTTTANNSIFNKFFGAGYGGTSYNRVRTKDLVNGTNYGFNDWVTSDYSRQYSAGNSGIATNYEYELFAYAGFNDNNNVGRFYVNYAQVSLANTRDVTSTLTDCTIETNFYGGGNLGAVTGDVTSTLTNTKVKGNAFGAGYSAAAPTVDVFPKEGMNPEPHYNTESGTYTQGGYPTPVPYTWKHADAVSAGNEFDENGGHYILTTVNLSNLGKVTGNVTLTINGTKEDGSIIGNKDNDPNNAEHKLVGNVYGGGEQSDVARTANDDNATNGNTIVNVAGTTIISHDVFGGGKGLDTDYSAANVAGNSTVTIEGSPQIYHSVYGGGQLASVGTFTYDETKHVASTCTYGGTAKVNIYGGTLGRDGQEDGMVYGSSRGEIYAPGENDKFAWVKTTQVNIGSSDENVTTSPTIKGSIYGSGENGHTLDDATVNIVKGTIGIAEGTPITVNKGTAQEKIYTGAEYPYRGNVYGGGCGTDTYTDGDNTLYNPLSGIVFGNARVNISGGQVVRNVYGAGAMGSVGKLDDSHVFTSGGTTTINISGGKIGVSGTVGDGNVFGAARGDATSSQTYVSLVKTTDVNISGSADIKGSVYGGGEVGDVGTYTTDEDNTNNYTTGSGICDVNITNGTIHGDVYGAGKGVANTWTCEKAMVNTTSVTITNGTVSGNVYGGGEVGRVEYDAAVTIGTENETGETSKPTITGSVYGAGAGLSTHGYSALVRGNSTVTVQGVAQVDGSVYGGGEVASVGRFLVVGGLPKTPQAGGTCTVTVKDNAKIGTSGTDHHVFGACKGVTPAFDSGNVKNNKSMQLYDNRPKDGTEGTDWDYYESDNRFVWVYYKTEADYLAFLKTLALTSNTHVTIDESASVYGSVYGGGERGITLGGVDVNITGGTVSGDVYGGGSLADSNYSMWDATNSTLYDYVELNLIPGLSVVTGYYTKDGENNYTLITETDEKAASGTTYYAKYKTNVDLTGGTITGSAYGGALGDATHAAAVYGDVEVNLNQGVAADAKGCIVSQVFGCNNTNGTPKDNVTVHVYATQNSAQENINTKYAKVMPTEADDVKTLATSLGISTSDYDNASTDEARATALEALKTAIKSSSKRYDVTAVYGGGNNAAYIPASPYTSENTSGSKTQVIIEGCAYTSIQSVYGGGNAASVPETNIEVKSDYEIGYVFSGGNGSGDGNPGADVGQYKSGDEQVTYGTGNVNAVLKGGLIHEAYGGSNEKGTIVGKVNLTTDPEGDCELTVEKIVGAGKNADINGDVILVMGCMPETKTELLFAGADNANVNGNVELTITSGTFGQVFCGNNLGGAIKGHLKLNIEETGCRAINIDELYLGGNEAAYSIYGYKQDGDHLVPRSSDSDGTAVENPDNTDGKHPFPYAQPVMNIISATSIGKVFGGGLGTGAYMYASPTVNINMIPGRYADNNALGTIGDVYGGGNAADVYGNTTINIGTETTVSMTSYNGRAILDSDPDDAKTKTVFGARITGSVYGGGNLANVGKYHEEITDGKTTDVIDLAAHTTVNIGAKYDSEQKKYVEVTQGTSGVTIGGNILGGGKGVADSFRCGKAMVTDSTYVVIGAGTITGSVYGGGEIGRVEKNTRVIVGVKDGTNVPVINGDVFGAGMGLATHGYSALVRGDATVIVQGHAEVKNRVFGGGMLASVGKYNVDNNLPTTPVSGGVCRVTVRDNAVIGPDGMKMYYANGNKPDDKGHVVGAGMGILPYKGFAENEQPWHMIADGSIEKFQSLQEVTPGSEAEKKYFKFIRSLGLASDTYVTIGGNAFVKGSVYGGSMNGYVQRDTNVKIEGTCQIGQGEGKTEMYTSQQWEDETASDFAECAHWNYDKDADVHYVYDPFVVDDSGNGWYDTEKTKTANGGHKVPNNGQTFYGNVFAGGCGYYPFAPGRWLDDAGSVGRNATLTMTGGHVLTSVYGGNEMTDVLGNATVTISGGTIGVPRTKEAMIAHPVTCYVFGGGKGDQRTWFNTKTNIHGIATVTVKGSARIFGSTFGGGEDGHVFGDVTTNIGESGVANTVLIGSTGTSSVDGNIFGGGRGFSASAYTAGSIGGNVNVNFYKGTIMGTLYGGGRLASVGSYFVDPYLEDGITPNPLYGTLQPDDEKTHGHVTIKIYDGTIGATDDDGNLVTSDFSIGDVFGGCKGTLYNDENVDPDKFGVSKYSDIHIYGGTINGNVYGGGEMGGINKDTKITVEETSKPEIKGNVYGGGMGSTESEVVGYVHHNVQVDIKGGIINGNVYGGGAVSNTNTHDKDNTADAAKCSLETKEDCTTKVNLTGGLIKGDCYGGGEGVFWEPTEDNKSTYMTDTSKPLYNQHYWNETAKAEYAKRAAIVWGDVTVTLNGTAFELKTETVGEKTIPTSGRIFGCNNINGTPKGTVLVHVKKTVALDNEGAVKAKPTKGSGTYELQAVYGGGNLAGYQPADTTATGQFTSYTDKDSQAATHNAAKKNTQVVIEGCDESSIEYVYGGGNAADVPATDVVILGAYEIGSAFAGGNGKDKNYINGGWRDNYGADIGAYWYTRFGSGIATINVLGGTVHKAYGGSNTLGDIYDHSDVYVDEKTSCDLCVDEIYGGGNEADTKGGSNIVLGCVDYMKHLFAGANAANVGGNVNLTITSGKFDQVFAGNNASGVIKGSLTINIEETGCNPIIIGELYGGGNNAPYSVYGYNDNGTCITSGTKLYNDPVLNIKSFTSIGRVFGGGRGADAIVYGSPTVNINEVVGARATATTITINGESTNISDLLGKGKQISVINTDGETTETLDMPTHASGEIGGIGYVYGGGNAADVRGNTTVNICTESTVTYVSGDKASHNVVGADIRYNVYGGGNIGSVGTFTRETTTTTYTDEFIKESDNVKYYKVTSCAEGTGVCTVNIMGNAEIGPDNMQMTADGGPDDYGMVFGACRGEVKEGNPAPFVTYADSTNVVIGGNAFIKGSVYGGSEDGNVLHNTHVTIQDNCQIGNGNGVNRMYTSEEWINPLTTHVTESNALAECAHWPYESPYYTHDKYATNGKYEGGASSEGGSSSASDGHTFYGNVFGGGAGYHPYDPGKWLLSAGMVEGNTIVDITGGHILTSIYGGNEMTDVKGSCTVNMSGGTLGVPRTLAQIDAHPVTCYLFGGGKGDHRTFFNKSSDQQDAIVNISGGTIYGSVFGGAEDGHVLGNVTMTISETDAENNPTIIGTWGTSYVDGNIFGGGRGFSGDAQTAGTVGGNVTMTISGGTMLGSIYGGGRLGSVGTYFAMKTDTEHYGKMQPDAENETHGHITINISGGTIGNSYEYDYIASNTTISDAYRTEHHIPHTEFLDNNHLKHTKGGNVFAGCMGRFYKLDNTTVMPIWHELAQVKKTILNISGGIIKSNVYGGGELGPVMQNTEVTITGGTIGTRIMNGETEDYTFGSVYGSGYGSDNTEVAEAMRWAGVVRGNTNVTIQNTAAVGDTPAVIPTILHNVYGGGELASVGTFTAGYTAETNYLPTVCTENTGTATVTITGGTIGTNGDENGMVFGSSRGDIHPAGEYDRLAWVNSTSVNIGTDASNVLTTPLIKGSIYGSGENGHTLKNTQVNIYSGTIGIESGSTITGSSGQTYDGYQYPYRGNVYGGGCGTDTYTANDKTYYNPLSGIVMGNTNVLVNGGYVVRSVYGGGAMGSVGTFTYADETYHTANPTVPIGKPYECADGTGTCTVTVNDNAVIGPNGMKMLYDADENGKRKRPDDAGHVFGGSRGEMHDPADYPNLEKTVYVNATNVTIGGSAFVKGSVYGGAESGHVLDSTYVKIQDNCQIGNGDGMNRMYTSEEWTAALGDNPTAHTLAECAHWPYTNGVHTVYDPFVTTVTTDEYGNQTAGQYSDGTDANGGVTVPQNGQSFFGCVFAGGSGYYPYAAGKWLDSAGLIEGNARVEMTGGHVLTNIYGGNEMTDVKGYATVTITGGTIGVPRTKEAMIAHPVTCYVFGGGRGDQRTWFNTKTNIHKDANVTVTNTARVFGSVFGGGEDGHVFGDVNTVIGNTTVTVGGVKTTYSASNITIGTTGTSSVDGNIFGGGRGFAETAYTAGSIGGNVNLTINSGTMLGTVYGGGRLASVGSWFVNPKVINPETGEETEEDDPRYGTLQPDITTNPQKLHGHITININGGTIGATDNGVLRSSEFSIGDVFGGCKGSTNATEAQARKFGIAKYTTINMTNGTVNGNIYGGGEAGNILQDTKIIITQPEGKSAVVKGNVYGGGSNANVGGNTTVSIGQ